MQRLLILTFIGLNFLCASYVQANLLQRVEVKQFIDKMVLEHEFDRDELGKIFGQVKFSEGIIKAISRPAEKLAWFQYRPIFLKQDRIELGVKFWQEHEAILARAEKRFGVPAEIMVAIIGVETRYGDHKGKYKVINSLSTLAFDYPKRSEFFSKELEHYLLMTREQKLDPLSVMGSYAGAMGIPQFISSSYRAYAIDFNDDGVIDIWSNISDTIGSVANYFRVHGWIPGEGIAVPVAVKGDQYQRVLNNDLKPDLASKDLEKFGIVHGVDIPPDTRVKLLDFETRNGFEYWLGFENFYVITRYNHSMLYAMAVYQLAIEIRTKYSELSLVENN